MILCISGSRADYGYMEPVRDALGCEMLLLGGTIGCDLISLAGESADSMETTARRLMRADVEMVVVVGDRWEILSACQAAVLANVPIAHIGSGEVTLGAYDDKFRKAIESLADLHFCLTQKAYSARGGDGILTGCTSVQPPETIHEASGEAILAIYPETRGQDLSGLVKPVKSLLEARGLRVRVIGSNQDVGSADFPGESLPLERFHMELGKASLMVGNSSAGIIEAPILCTPSVNIGRRQEGRPHAGSVFQAEADLADIERAVDEALAFGKKRVESPYYRENAVQRIIEGIRGYLGKTDRD